MYRRFSLLGGRWFQTCGIHKLIPTNVFSFHKTQLLTCKQGKYGDYVTIFTKLLQMLSRRVDQPQKSSTYWIFVDPKEP